MATVKEVIKSLVGYDIPEGTLDVILLKQGLTADAEFDPTDKVQERGIDLSRVDAIDFLIMQPKSVKELDYQITQQDADALLAMRDVILGRWCQATDFVDLSNTH